MGFYLNKKFIKIKMVSTSINRPKQKVHKNHQRLARLKKQRSKANKKATEYIIPDADVMPMSHIRKLLKRLRRQQPAAFEQRCGKMEIEAEAEAGAKAEGEEKTKDVEMEEAE